MGWEETKTVMALHGYRDKDRNTNGMGTYMKIKMRSFSDEDINALAKYISTLKKED